MAKKPTVYVDTNLVSAMHYKGRNPAGIYRRIRTVEWWKEEKNYFDVRASSRVELELNGGEYRGKEKALSDVRRLRYLTESKIVRSAARTLLQVGIVPENEHGDAVHLAFAIVHVVDYLLTWNHAHLANVDTQQKLDSLCLKMRWRPVLLVSPESIPKHSLGQELKRKD